MIDCLQCDTDTNENCRHPNVKPTPCPENHTACAKYYNLFVNSKHEKIIRTCATRKLETSCSLDDDSSGNPIKICMYWCDTDGCNSANSLLLSNVFLLKFLCLSIYYVTLEFFIWYFSFIIIFILNISGYLINSGRKLYRKKNVVNSYSFIKFFLSFWIEEK